MANSIILNLHVIGSARAGDKLFTSTPEFSVQVQGPMSHIVRRYYGENRMKNLNDVLCCVHAAVRHMRAYDDDNPRIQRAFALAEQGLVNLQDTYCDDPRCVGQIQIIRDIIQAHSAENPA